MLGNRRNGFLLQRSAKAVLSVKAVRIKRYYLVSAPDPEKLQNEVNKLIGEGWQPYGHTLTAESTAEVPTRFLQAMVQYEGEIRS